MFRQITGRLTFRSLVKIALAGWLVLQGQAYADECRFGDGGGNTTVLTGGSAFGVHWFAWNTYSTIVKLTTFTVNLSPALTSHCSAGNDGHSLLEKVTSDYTYTSGRGPQPDGKMGVYFLTNVPGILFSVKIVSPAGGGYFGGDGSEQVPGWTTLVDTSSDMWDGQDWRAEVTLWQDTGEFMNAGGNKANASYITPKASFTLGQMSLGDPGDSNNRPWTFNVTPSSFQIPIVPSTCQTAQLDSGTNTVDLGDYMISEFKASPRTHPFRIQLLGCDNVYAVDFKMTTNKVTGSQNELLGNVLENSDAATGVGVKIHATNLGRDIPANGLDTTIYSNDTGAGTGLGMLTFEAQLIKDGNQLRAGNFKALTTFQMTYY
ncbi:fimbrial protein [Enterobacter sp. SGAir0187]|uniref:fimbrial protein n=1 Tax=Enterobacter sp. SGAir0187 TaxID=2836161 RepID=UPI001375B0A6|nr:fimbrial protein [Enterobacter sp. SGAir0187]